MSQQYVYHIVEVVKVTDGDTYWLRIDVGFRETMLINVRLHGYDCPERTRGSEFEKSEGKRATLISTDFLARKDGTLWVKTLADPDNFGRWLGDVWLEAPDETRRHLGAELRRYKLASVWPERWRHEFDKI